MAFMKERVRAIRQFCLDCNGDSEKGVRECTQRKCALFPFRMGSLKRASAIDGVDYEKLFTEQKMQDSEEILGKEDDAD